jgi:hypothetical protein
VNEKECGLAVDLHHKTELKKALERMVEMENEDYKRISENCIKFIEQNTNSVSEIEAYKNLFNK